MSMSMDETTARRHSSHALLFGAIEKQRLNLLNVLGMVHCLSQGVANDDEHPTPEISAAFQLLEGEILRVATALQKNPLWNAMRVTSTTSRRHYPRRGHAHDPVPDEKAPTHVVGSEPLSRSQIPS